MSLAKLVAGAARSGLVGPVGMDGADGAWAVRSGEEWRGGGRREMAGW